MYPRTVPVEHYSLAHLLDSGRAGKFRILRPGSGEVHGLRSGWVVVGNRPLTPVGQYGNARA
jgi:hypothetical protein